MSYATFMLPASSDELWWTHDLDYHEARNCYRCPKFEQCDCPCHGAAPLDLLEEYIDSLLSGKETVFEES